MGDYPLQPPSLQPKSTILQPPFLVQSICLFSGPTLREIIPQPPGPSHPLSLLCSFVVARRHRSVCYIQGERYLGSAPLAKVQQASITEWAGYLRELKLTFIFPMLYHNFGDIYGRVKNQK